MGGAFLLYLATRFSFRNSV